MAKKVKRISIQEFRKKGYLQELNRRFLHPLGLALEVVLHDDGRESLGGVWDYRKDKEGIYYNVNGRKGWTIKERGEFLRKYNYVERQLRLRRPKRERALGFFIEPIVCTSPHDLKFLDERKKMREQILARFKLPCLKVGTTMKRKRRPK